MKRRNSYSEETESKQYDNNNPPTLPRRSHGPPTFKPTPPPASNGQLVIYHMIIT